MTRKVILPAALFIIFLWTVVIFLGACAKKDEARPVYEGPMRIGKPFPHFQSAPPATDEERGYLGIEEGPFSLSDVESKMLVIEFFNVYCVSCQLQAPLLQEYFEEIEKDKEMSGKLKVLAFGAGNTQKEVDRFRDDNNLGFPMVPDPDYEIYAKLGAPERTPFLVFVKRFEEPEPMEMVTNFHRGVIRDQDEFLSMVEENLAMTVDEIRAKAERIASETKEKLEPPLSREELLVKIEERVAGLGRKPSLTKEVPLQSGEVLFVSEVAAKEGKKLFFTRMVGTPSVCDVCHDLFFIYTFDEKGILVDFDGIHLTKYGNTVWTDFEVDVMRKRLVGRTILKPFPFDAETDAVATGTITSSIIFREIDEAKKYFSEFEEKGLL